VIKPTYAANATAHGVGMLFSIAPSAAGPVLNNCETWPRLTGSAAAQRSHFSDQSSLEVGWNVGRFNDCTLQNNAVCSDHSDCSHPCLVWTPTERHNRTVLTARCRGRFGTRTRQQPRHHSVGISLSACAHQNVNSPRGPILHVVKRLSPKTKFIGGCSRRCRNQSTSTTSQSLRSPHPAPERGNQGPSIPRALRAWVSLRRSTAPDQARSACP